MSKKRDRWDFWTDLIIPVGAAVLLFVATSSIFAHLHHAGAHNVGTNGGPASHQPGSH